MHLYPGKIPPYPIQHVMTKDIRQASAMANNPEYMSLWAEQGLRLANDQSAATIIKETIDQAKKLVIKSYYAHNLDC